MKAIGFELGRETYLKYPVRKKTNKTNYQKQKKNKMNYQKQKKTKWTIKNEKNIKKNERKQKLFEENRRYWAMSDWIQFLFVEECIALHNNKPWMIDYVRLLTPVESMCSLPHSFRSFTLNGTIIIIKIEEANVYKNTRVYSSQCVLSMLFYYCFHFWIHFSAFRWRAFTRSFPWKHNDTWLRRWWFWIELGFVSHHTIRSHHGIQHHEMF